MADRGDAGRRLDLSIQRHLAGTHRLSRAATQRLIATGHVAVNGRAVRRAAGRLAAGDLVAVDGATSLPAPRRPEPEALDVDVLYEDADLLVVVKPAGVTVHPTSSHRRGTLLNALLGRASAAGAEGAWTPHLVQRLDRDTSGLVLVAKSGAVHAALQRAGDVCVREYLTVVWGTPRPSTGTIEGRLGRDLLDRRRVAVREGGAAALTAYECLDRSRGNRRGLSLVRCRLHTGRTHQIRVHLADRGWPIVGDPVYGRPPRARLADPVLDRHARGFARQALHAWRLSVAWPTPGRVLRFEAPLPDDLARLLDAAGLHPPRR
ncbi:MAG: RluA family pseudouridine synthase [Vicinamibacterales bacterium]